VTRQVLLEIGRGLGIPMLEETLTPADLLAADEAFITSTLKEAAPVRAVDGKPVGNGRPGPVTLRLLDAYREYAARQADPAR
jgi:branched-subunit amino acid aminotransferase/4-amino-4-deoxychorismate lyase